VPSLHTVSLTRTQLLKSRMRPEEHIQFANGGGVADRPAKHNVGFALSC
jgi:hypothetical protein